MLIMKQHNSITSLHVPIGGALWLEVNLCDQRDHDNVQSQQTATRDSTTLKGLSGNTGGQPASQEHSVENFDVTVTKTQWFTDD